MQWMSYRLCSQSRRRCRCGSQGHQLARVGRGTVFLSSRELVTDASRSSGYQSKRKWSCPQEATSVKQKASTAGGSLSSPMETRDLEVEQDWQGRVIPSTYCFGTNGTESTWTVKGGWKKDDGCASLWCQSSTVCPIPMCLI